MNEQIEVLTALTVALLGELESLYSTVAATRTDSASGPELSLAEVRNADFRIDFYKEVERYEIGLIKRALKHSSGNQRKAAQLLALNSTTLHAKIKHYGIHSVELPAHYASRRDGFHRPGRVRTVLTAQDRIPVASETESTMSNQRDSATVL